MQSLGILGGTFNPVHIGHLLLADTALTTAQLDQVLWVPNHKPPHRQTVELINPQHRVEMVRLAIASHPQFTLADVEAEPTASGYAVDTFFRLQRMYSSVHWSWIVGLDAFKALPRWYRRQDWVTHCQWLVAPRRAAEGSATEVQAQLECECHQVAECLRAQGITLLWKPLPMPLVDISSSTLRQACRTGHSIRYRVPDAVHRYIYQQALYTADATA